MKIFIIIFSFIGLCRQLHAQQATGPEDDTVVVNQEVKEGILISGQVFEASNNQPLPGINVSVTGYSSEITSLDGSFSIIVPSLAATLLIEGPGFQYKEVPLKGRTEISVSLFEEGFNSVYDIVTMPGQNLPGNHLTNSGRSIELSDHWQKSTETIDNYLQGKVAGLNVIRRSGTPGIGSDILLRGFSSLNATNTPLIVVDGMIYNMNEYSPSLISGHFSNPLALIDLRDIDNITVLKDAVSQYGSRAANGVILITTSTSKNLATRLDFGVSGGINYAPKTIPVMGDKDYRLYLNDVVRSQGISDETISELPFMNDDPARTGYYTWHNNTDWQKEVFGNSSSKDYYLKITGGDNIARYALSLGYADQAGIIKNTELQRSNVRFNADFNISKKLTANANMAYTNSQNTLKDQGIADRTNPLYLGLTKAPILTSHVRGDDGSTSPNIEEEDVMGKSNPVAAIENINESSSNNRFFGSVNFDYKLNDEFKVSSLFGITYDKIKENLFYPRKGITAYNLENAVAESTMGVQNQQLLSMYNDTRFSYSKNFQNNHMLNVNAGLRFQTNKIEQDYILGYNSATDDYQTVGTGETALRETGGDIGKWVWLNYYANVNYNYLRKYFLTYSMSMDGSSRFGDDIPGAIKLFGNQFGIFPSIAGAWLVSSENFMSNVQMVDLLKLRVSYGITGNDDIGNYRSNLIYGIQNFLGYQGIVRAQAGNPSLQWETNKKLNLGVDLALLNEKVQLTVDVYQNNIDNMLTYELASPLSGWEYVLTNSGEMQNRGLEITLNSRVINGNSLKWDFGLTLAANKNKVTALPQDNLIYNYAGATILTRVGEAGNMFYGYKTNGVYSTEEEAAGAGLKTRLSNGELVNFRGGDVRFIDNDTNGEINEADKVIIGNPNPDLTGMISNNFTYKRFSLHTAISFSYGNDVYNYTRARLESVSGYNNQTIKMANRWTVDGQQTDVPRANYGDPLQNSRFSDRWIEDGSYIRLRSITLSYNIPVHSSFFKYANVYCTGNNLVTFTRYLGYDPEFSQGSNFLNQGMDVGMVPQFKSMMMGIRVGL